MPRASPNNARPSRPGVERPGPRSEAPRVGRYLLTYGRRLLGHWVTKTFFALDGLAFLLDAALPELRVPSWAYVALLLIALLRAVYEVHREQQSEIATLQKRLKELQTSLPQLSLVFEKDGELVRHMALRVRPYIDRRATADIDAEINRTRARLIGDGTGLPFGPLALVSSKQRTQYLREVDEYLTKQRVYIQRKQDWHRLQSRSFAVAFAVLNSGSCPASDVTIQVGFPEELRVHSQSEPARVSPEAPEEPNMPTLFGLMNTIPFGGYTPLVQSAYAAPEPVEPPVRLVVRGTEGRVDIEIAKLMHHLPQTGLDAVIVVVPEERADRAFTIDYTVHASELPEPSSGSLTVLVEYSE